MTHRTITVAAGLLALVAVLATAPALAKPKADWDQKAITQLAEQFATQVNDVYRSVVRKKTGANIRSGQAASFLRYRDGVRLVRSESRHFERELQAGGTHDDTVMVFERLLNLIRRAQGESRTMFLEKPTIDKIAAARETLRKIAPYYDPDVIQEIDEAAEQRR